MMYKLKGRRDKGGHYEQADAKGGNMMCKFKGQMDKGGHYGVQIKKGGWIKGGIMMWKSKGGCKRWHYDVQIKRADGYRTAL